MISLAEIVGLIAIAECAVILAWIASHAFAEWRADRRRAWRVS